jgi:hypothetical protein
VAPHQTVAAKVVDFLMHQKKQRETRKNVQRYLGCNPNWDELFRMKFIQEVPECPNHVELFDDVKAVQTFLEQKGGKATKVAIKQFLVHDVDWDLLHRSVIKADPQDKKSVQLKNE